MQFKGVVRFFLIAFSLVCLWQFSLMIPTNRVEKAADVYADDMAAKYPKESRQTFYAKFLDSMSTEKVHKVWGFKDFTYAELKKSQLALGLDLKGGMSVLLQVDLRDFLRALSGNSVDPAFVKSLDEAAAALKTEQRDYITLFAEAWKRNGEGRTLASIFARGDRLKGKINFDTPDPDALRVIREQGNQTVTETYKRLKQRIDKLGVVAPNVNLDPARDLINVELPGIDNPQRAREMLQKSAKLEFWETYRLADEGIVKGFQDADTRLKALLSGDTTSKAAMRKDTTYEFVVDPNGNPDTTKPKQMVVRDVPTDSSGQGPLINPNMLLINGGGDGQTALLGYADKNKIPLISEYLNRAEIKPLFPADLVFRWSQQPMEEFKGGESIAGKYELYAIKKQRGKEDPPLDGAVVTDASEQPDPSTGATTVSLQMNPDGARVWAEMTTRMAQAGNREVAILLDDEVVSAPRVINPITGGSTQITGNFTLDDAKDLANILEVGKLPAGTRIVQESQVGPSLGKDNINKSLITMILSVILLGIFMISYYARGGIVSVLALMVNIFFLIGGLASMGTVLTLPGIAGIVLTLATAIDASVIIYERIREELRHGLDTSKAINVGFSRAIPAIIDANVTHILVACVLMYFGLGPIKGFGTVLLVGVISSLFTAILVARMMTDWWQTKNPDMTYSYNWSEHWLVGVNYDWMAKRKTAYIFSGIVTLIAIASFFIRQFELGVDFKGGYSFNVQFDKPVDVEALRNALTPNLGGTNPIVKQVSTANMYNITTAYKINEPGVDAINDVIAHIHKSVETAGFQTSLDNFKSTDGKGTHIMTSTQVGATVADDIRDSSFKAGGWALALIFLYLLMRFRKWQFSAGAVIAIFHDVMITLGFFSLLHGLVPFSLEIDQAIIACILTIIGYSVNDTVIVFDRIREFARTYSGRPKEEVLNMAINSTLSRTLITSGTIFGVVLLLFIFGGSAIRGFSFGILVGMVFGTYSSIYIASAVAIDLIKGNVLEGKEIVQATNTPTTTVAPVVTKVKKEKASV